VWWFFGLYLSHFAGVSAYGALSTVLALFVALWIMNTVLILGLKLDAEVLRAKELQIGLGSQHYIQAAPRSDVAAQAQAKIQQDLEARGDAILNAREEDQ
ncbi:MAG: YihY/virulence factor BrkB family protein, partial [Corynebacterium striatum]|nr:YihY/virulence factor BrkB family protein [Corynebacterium striatum]